MTLKITGALYGEKASGRIALIGNFRQYRGKTFLQKQPTGNTTPVEATTEMRTAFSVAQVAHSNSPVIIKHTKWGSSYVHTVAWPEFWRKFWNDWKAGLVHQASAQISIGANAINSSATVTAPSASINGSIDAMLDDVSSVAAPSAAGITGSIDAQLGNVTA